VGLLIKAPLAFYIASIAEDANVPYRFFENKDALNKGTMSDETLISMMKRNNPTMFNYIREKVNEGIREGNTPVKGQEGFLGTLGDKE
jgi:ribosomal protein L7Ae-like RNA K-turn-binding protein